MSYKDDFNLFVGAKYGIFKGVKAIEGGTPVLKSIQSLEHLSKDHEITAMAWNNLDEEEILLGMSNQVVKTYDTDGKVFSFSTDTKIVSDDASKNSKGSICGLSRYNGALLTAVESGHIRIFRYEEDIDCFIHAGENLSKMRHPLYDPTVIGTGGLENELKLWDLNTGKNTWTAKNVPNDQVLQLRVKVWVTDHIFMPNSDKVAVGSRYGYVRLYDPKAQRRPVVKVNMPEQAVTCITASNREHMVLCGLAKGNIAAVDLRNGKTSHHYKGFLGAVRDVACHPTEPYIASVSYDRFLRVHHAITKELLVKEYLVSRMNCVLMRSNFTLKPPVTDCEKKGKKRVASSSLLSDGQSDSEEVQEYDEMFESMEKVLDSSKRKSQKISTDTAITSKSLSKKDKSLIMNPFATKTEKSNSVERKSSGKKKETENLKQDDDSSDDDIMIVSESVAHPVASNSNEDSENEPDEADGESDEFDSNEDD